MSFTIIIVENILNDNNQIQQKHAGYLNKGNGLAARAALGEPE
jgi:hypothetical protein